MVFHNGENTYDKKISVQKANEPFQNCGQLNDDGPTK